MSPVDPPAPERAGSVRQSGLLRAGLLHRRRQPVLGVFHLHHPELAQDPFGHHRPRLSDHRIAGVVVGQHEERIGLGRHLRQLLRLGQRRGQRLVADHVDATPEELAGRRRMHVVGRHDRHRLDAVLPPRLALGHGGEVVVGAIGGQPQSGARGPGLLRRRTERARDQFVVVVHPRRDPVHRADEGVLAAADHAQPDAGRFRLAHLVPPWSFLSRSTRRGSPAPRLRSPPPCSRRCAARSGSPPRGRA